MIEMPNTPQSFLDLLGMSIKHHYAVLKKTILLILMIVVVKDWYIYLGGFPQSAYLKYPVAIIMLALLVYLFMTMLFMTNRILHNEQVNLSDAFSAMNKRLKSLYLAILIFIVVPAVFVVIAEIVFHMLTKGNPAQSKYAGLIFVFAVGIPILYAYLRYFFTIPLIVMEATPIWQAFDEAQQLVQGSWARMFSIYACAVAIWVLVSPDTLSGHLMKVYHISAAFDFIVFAVTLPIMMNLIVFVLNDLRQRAL